MEEIRSMRCTEKAYVRFLNLTDRTVEIIWINFSGAYVSYQILQKGTFIDINTYKHHPWMAIDHHTKDRLHIDKEFYYFPKTGREYLQNRLPDREIPERLEFRCRAVITLPIYSLRYTTLLTIRNCLKHTDDADCLELPIELANDLKKVITRRHHFSEVQSFIRIGGENNT